MSLRLLIADDHTLLRAGIRSLLERTFPDIDVQEASDGTEMLAMAAATPPDIALVDITMPGLNGIDAAQRLRDSCPDCKVVMLSMHQDDMQVVRAMRAGAHGYLLKDAAVAELGLALDAVRRGQVYLSRDLSAAVRDMVVTGQPAEPDPLARLSPRQREVLQLIAEGQGTKEIAYRLGLSAKTVETHRKDLMARLDIHDVAGLTRFAVRHGLTTVDT
ncbi:DNA-binding response regulator [Luteitalea sp. TBR-22]|uniref:response regulator n=1 Tax=Luteitalea sp. TBR-22 TaxID=2802971 RepID=UPI001AFB307A|nr:response regulator transcription factor [Luteitalea sp. TBR-22]BCS35092.1 DNA-binding response regulator [Luteitalea sp. TBR-22]